MTNQQIEFLNMIAPIAVRQALKHNNALFASVTIAQAIHESGWGTSKKMVNANALFGVKVGNSAYKFGTAWKGAAYKTGTTEYYDGKNPTKIVDYFRKYDSVEDATEDYMDMLCHCNRYKAALNRSTPAQSIVAIVAGGYATGPEYATRIMELINQNNLTVFDRQHSTVEPTIYWQIGKDYIAQQDLNIRKEPNGDKLMMEDLTANGKQHAFIGTDGTAILRRGTKVTVKDAKVLDGVVWLKIPSGWICGKNTKNYYVL